MRGRPLALGVVGLVVGLALAGCGRRWSVGVRADDRAFDLRLPAVVAHDLEGGARVYALRGGPGSVLVGVALRAPAGAVDDRPLQQLTYAALADEAELAANQQGALFAAEQIDDGVTWYIQTTSEARAELLAGQAALLQAPRHDPARIAALHDEHRAVIDAWSVEPLQIARSYVRRAVYPADEAYGRPLIGRRDLARIGVAEIRGHYPALVRPGDAAVIVIADGDPEALAAEARGAFEAWSMGQVPKDMSEGTEVAPGDQGGASRAVDPASGEGRGPGEGVEGVEGSSAAVSPPASTSPSASPSPAVEAPSKGRTPGPALAKSGRGAGAPPLLLLEAPALPQTILILERATLPRSDPDYVYLDLGAAVLGSVLHRRLREDRSLTYGVSVTLSAHRGPSPLTIATQVDRERADEALEAILEALVDLQRAPVDETVGDHFFPAQGLDAMLAVETSLGAAAWIGRGFLYDADARTADAELGRLHARAADEVNRVMAELLRPEAFTIAIVGDPARLDAVARRVPRPSTRRRLEDVRAALIE